VELDSYDTATGEQDQPSSFAQDDSEPTPHHAESGRSRGVINTWVGFLILAVGTSLVASVEMIAIGSIGWFTGVAFVVACIVVAVFIRSSDLSTAVISPPLAFLFAVVISTQFAAVGASGNLWLHEATTMITSLAFNAPWVFAGTGAALIIVLMRASAARRAAAKAA
jgi:hypothetical protein